MEQDKGNLKKLIWVVAFGILLFWALQNIAELSVLLGVLLGLIMPFLVGLIIAFILNVPMRFIERRLLSPLGKKAPRVMGKLSRPLGLLLAMAFLIGVVTVVMLLIIPELGRTIRIVSDSVPGFIEGLQEQMGEVFRQYPDIARQLQSFEIDWDGMGKMLFGFVSTGASNVLSSTFSIAASLFSGIFTFFLGLIFAIYVLLQKERLARQTQKLMAAYLPSAKSERTLEIATLVERTFSRFLSGQCIEAVILGAIFFVLLSIFKFPYTLLISVLIGFLALIPIFGAFIGCAVGAFLIVMISPMQALWFIILFLVVQQVEGNLIYPRVVGSSIGLPAIWVLVAVTLGGSAMGIMGMLINIPLCSVLYTLLREDVNRRIGKKEEAERAKAAEAEGTE